MRFPRLLAHRAPALSLGIALLTGSMPAAFSDEAPTTVESVNGKRALTPADFPLWKEIDGPQLSADGKWLAYTLQVAQDASGMRGQREVVVRGTSRNIEYRFPTGRVAGDVTAWSPEFEARSPVKFTSDSRFVLFSTIEDLGSQPDPHTGALVPRQRASLAIVRMSDGQLTQVPGVSTFKLPQRSGRWVSYVKHELIILDAAKKGSSTQASADALQARPLVLRDLTTGEETTISDVTGIEFDETARHAVYAVTSSSPARNGVYVRRLSDGFVQALMSGPGTYVGLTLDDRTKRVAFLSDRDARSSAMPRHSIYLGPIDGSPAQLVVQATSLPQGMLVSAQDGVQFTPRGNALTFMIAPVAKKIARAATAHTRPRFEFWQWQASAYWPNGEKPLNPYPWSASAAHFGDTTYLSVYHIDKRRWTRLETPAIREVLLSDDGQHALGVDRGSHALRSVVDKWTFDLYDIDVATGAPRLIRAHVQPAFLLEPAWRFAFQLSPGGEYVVFVENDRWWSYHFSSKRLVNFSGPGTDVVRRTLYLFGKWQGTTGWTAEDRRMLLYDEHDLWAYDPAGKAAPRKLTDGLERGRIYHPLHETTIGRMGLPDDEVRRHERSPHSGWRVDLTRPLLLETQDITTGDVGLWQLDPAANAVPRPLLMKQGQRVVGLAQASNAREVLVALESFADFPDLWTGANLARLHRVTHTNPQQREYLWGSEALISIKSETQATLRGRLYKPENFDPRRRYPLIVFVYQTEALRMFHRYGTPRLQATAYSSSSVPSYLTSNGYVALQPDIATVSGAPMKSAVDAIVPAVQAMLDTGYIDPERIALIGHSFGGHETLYTITQAPGLFRCAVASAGGSNLIAAYGSQSFGGTMPAYMKNGQGVMRVSPWDDPYRYMQNSAIFYADRVTTPLLMMHNDQDNAVAYSEGFQFFAALRSLGKEVYFYNYSGESHVLGEYANIADWHTRMTAFLDHCLKEAPRPAWMSN